MVRAAAVVNGPSWWPEPDEWSRLTPEQRQMAERRLYETLGLRLRYSPFFPHPKQAAFLSLSDYREVFFGGAAGPGKSTALLMAALQYVDVPGYSAIIFRRTYQDLSLPGALMDKAREWLAGTDARWSMTHHRWVFPSGAKLQFGYLEHEQDKLRYKGAEFQCVARGTGIVMGDGTSRPVEAIRAGESVMSTQGPKRVTRIERVGVKPVVRVETSRGADTVSASHPLLTAAGTWASPSALASIQRQAGDTTSVGCQASIPARGTRGSRWPLDPVHTGARGQRGEAAVSRRGCAVSVEDDRSGSAASGGGLRADRLPLEWFARLGLHEPSLRSEGLMPSSRAATDALVHGRPVTSSRDSLASCGLVARRGGGQDRLASTVVRGRIPSRGDAARLSRPALMDDQGGTRGHNRSALAMLVHPYTMEAMVPAVAVRPGDARIVPAGEAEVWDLTVEEANNYVLSSSGIISRNCICFDELTDFTNTQYRYLFSRCRKSENADFYGSAIDGLNLGQVPLRIRSASNPGGKGHVWVKRRLVDNEAADPGRVFIRARIEDNPSLDQREYEEMLAELPPLEAAQLMRGDWEVTSAGSLFKRADLMRSVIPRSECPDLSVEVRAWDTAATEESSESPDPDWTVGVKVGVRTDGKGYVVTDVQRFRRGPGDVEDLLQECADEIDGSMVAIRLNLDPGSAGKIAAGVIMDRLYGYSVDAKRETGTKDVRAKPAATLSQRGRLWILDGAWVDDFIDELADFPGGDHDDQVDALSAAVDYLRDHRPGQVATVSGDVPTGMVP